MQYVKFKVGVILLQIVEIQEGAPCLVTENKGNEISFFKLSVHNAEIRLHELCDHSVALNDKYDNVRKFRSVIFKCEDTGDYKQCGLALRYSGSLDFFWNFRVVDSFIVRDKIIDGFVDDIESDFGFLYYKIIKFEGSKKLFQEL